MILPIVGSWFRPPAGAIVKSLPVGTPLLLRPEPTNPADSFAIAVIIFAENLKIQEKDMNAVLKGIQKANMTPEEFAQQEEVHLGYIPALAAAQLQSPKKWNRSVGAMFTVTSDGKPAVRFDLPNPNGASASASANS